MSLKGCRQPESERNWHTISQSSLYLFLILRKELHSNIIADFILPSNYVFFQLLYCQTHSPAVKLSFHTWMITRKGWAEYLENKSPSNSVPGVLLMAAVVLARTGVTAGGGIPAAMSRRGWIISLLNTLFFCHKFNTLTILL